MYNLLIYNKFYVKNTYDLRVVLMLTYGYR